jgi:hypothetical protein
MSSVPILDAVHQIRQVDPDGDAVQAARALGISFGDRPADECPFASYRKTVGEIESRLDTVEAQAACAAAI